MFAKRYALSDHNQLTPGQKRSLEIPIPRQLLEDLEVFCKSARKSKAEVVTIALDRYLSIEKKNMLGKEKLIRVLVETSPFGAGDHLTPIPVQKIQS